MEHHTIQFKIELNKKLFDFKNHLSWYLTETLIWIDIKQKHINTDDGLPTQHQEDLMIF